MLSELFIERFGLTKEGSDNLIKGIIYTALQNISFMFPVGLYAALLYIWINPLMGGEIISPDLGIFILGILIILGIIFAFSWKQYHFVYNTTYVESTNRRINLGENLRKLPLSFFERRDLADLTATIMNDCTDLEHVFSHAIPQLLGSILSLILVSIGLLIFDWRLAVALLWVVPVSFIILYISKRMIYRGSKIVTNDLLECGDSMQECIDSIRDLKSYNYENEYLSKLNDITSKIEKSRIKSELMLSSGVITGKVILNLGIVSVILLGSNLIMNGQVTIYTFLIFLIASATIYAPVENGLMFLSEILMMDIKIERAKEIEMLVTEEGLKDYSLDGYDLEFRNVKFNYDNLKDVLSDIDFIAKQGEVTALVGPSGGGKSTVSKLAARFWDPVSGEVSIGGQNLAELDSEKLLENFSIVFQDVILFNNTIMENIRVGKKDASDDEVINAAKLAECEEFVQKLPNGYNTIIGENGELLSGGQRQRISIARALLKNANIVLLDEATSFLDVENESKIQKAISTLIKNKTVIIIAHRMRTIANADKIVVLDDGRIVEQGSPDELLAQNGLFKHMVELQKLSGKWEI
ncbi:ATP-binding cassette, subfamily B [Methanobrevibacter gottschalkii]|uniref:ATP-binding cassette subfamily B protein n=2 Tax=Methanobrevibacter gottschalkii TaxID=190974 RepID=A0A3N5B1R0_9EURY|nr:MULTISPECIES: ABC transporter ATP-binding protein [Methanobrevibacter]OEC98526.1 ABC transporter ATP-binding protein [Methanobrevibacter sp. A27]RPF51506.1 ATP-binding cassette subfamily B protein [Methanobrevibacter gottschalkii DSM 11977]SEK69281.1 ATP-binding cassette, subfamily B [Methanobrevibacter gottschalkii]